MAGLTRLLVGVTAGGVEGWSSPLSFGASALGLAAFALLLAVEHRAPYPLFSLSLFKNRLFAMGNVANLFIAMERGAIVPLLVFYFQGGQGDSPLQAGILVIPLAIAMAVTAPLSGWIADRVGARGPASLGALLVAVGLLGFATTLTTAYPVTAG